MRAWYLWVCICTPPRLHILRRMCAVVRGFIREMFAKMNTNFMMHASIASDAT